MGVLEPWIVAALGAVLLKTGYDALQKRLTFDHDGVELSYITSVLGFLFMLPVGLWFLLAGDVTITLPVAAAVLLSGAGNVAAIVAFLSALELEDLSVVSPLVRMTPILVAVAEPFVLAAEFEVGVFLGALAAVLGAYVLLIDPGDVLAPVRRITAPATLLALAAAALYAGINIANRFIATQISPFLYAFLIYGCMAAGFVLIQSYRLDELPTRSLLRPRFGLLGGLTAARTSVTYVAFSLAAAARVSVVLQASIALSVLAGGAFFGEEGVGRKLVGALLIAGGVVLTL